jgi:sec-independent protein translocase protein TatC
MSFWDHLAELRTRLIRSVVIVVACFAFTYAYRFKLMIWAQKPFMDVYRVHALKQAAALHLAAPASFEPFAYTSLTEPFFSLMRLSIWAAAFIASPLLFHQLWGFIRPGLYARERRFAIPFVLATTGCFLAGAAFAYLNAFKFLGDILFQEALNAGLRTNLHLEDYLDLFIYTVVGTGLMFEMPVLVYFLARFRLLTARWMLKYWRHATIAILFAAAFLTPGDVVVTTIFFSVVLLGLYFVSILVAWLAAPRET